MGWVEDAVVRQADIAASAPKYGSGGGGEMIPAIIGAAGVLGGAALGGKAQKSVAKTQAKSAEQALNVAKEQDAYARAQYENALRAWDAGRQSLLSKYGITGVPSVVPQVPMSPGQPVGAVPRASGFSTQPAAGVVPAMVPAEAVGSTGPTLADVIRSRGRLGSAFDWQGAGLE